LNTSEVVKISKRIQDQRYRYHELLLALLFGTHCCFIIGKYCSVSTANQTRPNSWSLPSLYKAFTEVAKKLFEFIHETDDLNPENIAKTYCFHPACYRSFTDKSKLDRAKTTLTNAADRKRVADDNNQTNCPRPEKVTRTTRQSFSARSSNVLPEICLICKRHGSIYITDKVYRVLLYIFMCFCNINLFQSILMSQ
jgi:hypothetical protein